MSHRTITSPSNPVIKAALRTKKRSETYPEFLIEGLHLLEAALASGTRLKRVFFTRAFAAKGEGQRLLHRMEGEAGEFIEVAEPVMAKLSDTEAPQGIAAVASCSVIALGDIAFRGVPFLVVCDGIQDPGNLGTIIRASDAAGADGVVVLPGSCDVFLPKTVRATAGSLFSLPIAYSAPGALADYCEAAGILLVVADVHAAMPLYAFDFTRPVAVAFGNEAHGPGRELLERAKGRVKIPIIGKAESLNVAMSATVCLYEAVRQRWFAGDR